MNYITEIIMFQGFVRDKSLSTGQIALWYALMDINNRAGWTECFTVANKTLELNSGLSRSGILKTRNELKQHGLIDFKAKTTTATAYKILSMLKSVQDGTQVSNQISTQNGVQDGTQNSSTLYKQNNNKQNTMSETSSDESADKKSQNVETIDIDKYFEETYAEYPKKEGKKDGKIAYIQYLTKGREFKGYPNIRLNHAEIRIAVQEYVKSKYGTDVQFFPMFSTFMNGGIIDFIDGNNEEFRGRYEKVMAKTYGENWREIKFKYTGRGIDK